jgi:hypothetical protein
MVDDDPLPGVFAMPWLWALLLPSLVDGTCAAEVGAAVPSSK